jgi:chromosome segregation protein
MAEVSLTLSNENGDSPEELKEFTEINLTRRLYRSGESAYFLNKRPCRLKDIHNVFWGSGLGSKSYAVIQQGKIGAITDANPEELRFFVEEAAGVTRYKNRKTEALRKIELTKNNLLRVTDIISEIKRQMASLKRQARKAEIYNNYQKQIKAFEICLGLHYYGSNSNAGRKIRRYPNKNQINSKPSNDLVHLRNEIERLSQESLELKTARVNLQEKNHEMLSEIDQVEKETSQLNKEIITVKTRLNQERGATETIAEKLSTLNQDLESNKAQLMDLVAREAQYKNIYQTTINNKESLQKRLTKADEDKTLAKKQVARNRGLEEKARDQVDRIKRDINDLAEQISAAGSHLEQKNKALGKQVKLAQTLELECNTVKSKLNTLKKMEDNFEWYRDGVKAIMKPSSTGGPSIDQGLSAKILGLMADIIEAKPNYETAVEAVLGDALQYIIVKDQQTGLKAIEYLQSHNAGRSGFIPVTAVKQVENKQAAKTASGQLLLNQITVKSGYEPIIKSLLGHVVFSENLPEAIEMFNRNGASTTIVTKNGDVISPQGILVGGSKDKLNGILVKKQKLKDLSRQSTELAQKLEKARLDQATLESEARNLEGQLQKINEKKTNAARNEIEAEKELVKATEALKNASRHLEIVTLENEQLRGEASDIDEEMTKYNTALADLSAEVNTAQNKVSNISATISTVSTELDEYNNKVVDLQLQLTALNAKLENANNSLRRLKEFHSTNRSRNSRKTAKGRNFKTESGRIRAKAFRNVSRHGDA